MIGGIVIGVGAALLLSALVAVQGVGTDPGGLTLGRIVAIYLSAGVLGGAGGGLATLLGNGRRAQVGVGVAAGLPISFCMHLMMYGSPMEWTSRRWGAVVFVGAVFAGAILWAIRDSRITWHSPTR